MGIWVRKFMGLGMGAKTLGILLSICLHIACFLSYRDGTFLGCLCMGSRPSANLIHMVSRLYTFLRSLSGWIHFVVFEHGFQTICKFDTYGFTLRHFRPSLDGAVLTCLGMGSKLLEDLIHMASLYAFFFQIRTEQFSRVFGHGFMGPLDPIHQIGLAKEKM